MGLYAVGMVMKHKKYNYICVIYGWDAMCTASKVNMQFLKNAGDMVKQPRKFPLYPTMNNWLFYVKVWIRQMGVDQLHWKENQPFYNVLVEDGSCRYAASENLMQTKPQRISNHQVQHRFSSI